MIDLGTIRQSIFKGMFRKSSRNGIYASPKPGKLTCPAFQKSISDEDELPLHEMASSMGLSTSVSPSAFFPPPPLPFPLPEAEFSTTFFDVRETPNWKGVSVI